MMETLLRALIPHLDRIATAMEKLVPPAEPPLDIDNATGFRWRRRGYKGWLEAVPQSAQCDIDSLRCIDRQKEILMQNLHQFVAGLPANNMLLSGARGTGKSSLVKAALKVWSKQGLKLIEVEKKLLEDLPEIIASLHGYDGRFLLYCDDLGFSADDSGYRAIKATLDGSIISIPENILICATSNRRHLLPERMSDNQDSDFSDGELHPSEAVEEKISLAERFGLWISFHPFTQDQYLDIVSSYLTKEGVKMDARCRTQALRWALARGSRSGRCAYQFTQDWLGRTQLK